RGGDAVVAGAAVHFDDVLQLDIREIERLVRARADNLDVIAAGGVNFLDARNALDTDIDIRRGDKNAVVVARAPRVVEFVGAVALADKISVGSLTAIQVVVAGVAAN